MPIQMKFCFVEEMSAQLTHSTDEILDLVQDESIFVFPLVNQVAQDRSDPMHMVQHLKKIYILFAFNHIARN